MKKNKQDLVNRFGGADLLELVLIIVAIFLMVANVSKLITVAVLLADLVLLFIQKSMKK